MHLEDMEAEHNNAYDGQGESKSYRPSDAIRNDENKDPKIRN